MQCLEMVGKCAETWLRVQPKCPADDEAECSVCMEVFEAPLRTPCHHWFCGECILQVLQQRSSCPLCRHSPITRAELRSAVVVPKAEPAAEQQDLNEAGPCTSTGRGARSSEQVHVDSKMNVRPFLAVSNDFMEHQLTVAFLCLSV
jgi:hypothetical protein